MSSNPKQTREALAVYDIWLNSYLSGDVKTYDQYLDDDYRFIGSTGNEEFLSRTETTEFFKATADQLDGKTEVRNSTRTVEHFGDLLFITQLLDFWFLNEKKWSFYGRFRLTSVMHNRENEWKFIYQHFSTPDSKADSGDTIGWDQVNKENVELRDAVKRRTVELEHKSRELEVEAALERVRSRSMAMQKSHELKEVIQLIYKQFIGLGIHTEHAGIILDYKERDDMHIWLADGLSSPSELTIPYFDCPHWNGFEKAKKDGLQFFAVNHTRKEKDDFYRKLFEFVPEISEASKKTIFAYEGLAISTVLLDDVALYIENFDGIPYTDADNETLLRFGKVFQQTYTRFRDLQKAEAQAREAQIEASLERVRSRSMAMQKTEELTAAGALLYQELSKLGIQNLSTGYTLFDETATMGWSYGVNPSDGSIRNKPVGMDHTTTKVMKAIAASWKKQEPLLVLQLNEKETIKHQTFIADECIDFPISKEQLLAISPKRLVVHTFNFKQGYLLIVGGELLTEAQQHMISRFAKVFQQTYTRFLDLQKAEAQTREAQVNLAVERVRAKALAMHKSEEILQVVNTLKNEILGLNIPSVTAATIHLSEPDGKIRVWDLTSIDDERKELEISIDISYRKEDTHPDFFMREVWDRAEDYFVVVQGSDRYPHTVEWLVQNGYSEQAQEFEAFIEATGIEQAYHPTVPLQKGRMSIDMLEEPTPEVESILKKMAQAFDIAYKRFEDLQKAEAQAREAKIEAALEKVRSRSLAMHNSDELTEVVAVLFEKLKELQIPFTAVGIATGIEDSKDLNAFVCGQNDDGLVITNYRLPYFNNPIPKDLYGALDRQSDFFVGTYSKEEKDAFYEYVIENTAEFRHLPEDIKDMIFDSSTYSISMVAVKNAVFNVNDFEEKVLADHEIDILRRFAKVFDQAYTRFLDLQKAEAQTREAQIEAALERTRTQSMLMQHSDEIKNISEVFHQQLLTLNIPSEFSYVWLPDESKNNHQFWASWAEETEGGLNFSSKQVTYPLDKTEPYTAACYLAWSKPERIHEEFIPPSDISDFFSTWAELLDGAQKLKANNFKEGIYYSEAYMRYGCFGINIRRELSDEEKGVLKRFSTEFERAYTRFLDLQKAEAQARDAQIEASLERIRAKSMAMHHSDELDEVLAVLCEQFDTLGIFPMSTHMTVLDIANNKFTFRETGKFGNRSFGEQTVALDAMETWNDMVESWKSADPYSINRLHFPKETLPQVWEVFHESFASMPEDSKITQDDYPDGIFHTAGKHPFGYIGMNQIRKATEEEEQIVIKFANEFGRAYTRFLDLQKAEEQAREAKIETALEKVRSRTMGMQSSDELPEVANLMFVEIQSLGIPAWSCGYCIEREDGKSGNCIMSSEGTIQKPFVLPYHGEASFDEWNDFVHSERTFFTQELSGKAIESHYDFMKSLPQLEPVFQELVDAGLSLPTHQINHLCKFKHGFLLFITYEQVERSHEVFKRFTKVFEQTYTRFLDLQKAEAQAREAQIETALERVRSRTMAMQHSDELQEASYLLDQQVRALGIQTWGCAFNIYGEEDSTEWFGNEAGVLHTYTVPRKGIFKEYYEKGQKGESLVTKEFSGKACVDHYEYMSKLPVLGDVLKILKETNDGFPTYQMDHVVYFKYGYLLFITRENVPEAHDIFKRFAKVFEQTYTRFLDLQKAEKQAREAKIETSLERVRSRTTAMHNSEELGEVAAILFEQVSLLTDTPNRFNIGIVNDNQRSIDIWVTDQEGKNIDHLFVTEANKSKIIEELYETWKAGEKAKTQKLEGEQLNDWVDYMAGEVGVPFIKEQISTQRFINSIFFKQGFIGITTNEPVEKDTLQILERFAALFQQSYTRFLDLKKAEAQVREAKIETALEKVRSRTMGMQKSDELADVANVLFEEMNGLVHNLWTCGFVLCEKDREEDEWWLSLEDGFSRGFFLPNVNDYAHAHLYKGWLKKDEFRTVQLEGDKLQAHYDWLMEIPVAKNIFDEMEAAGMERPEWQKLHAAYFSKGYLVIITREPCPEEDIFKRFAHVFDLTYTRFLDLQKAEAQAREAQIENALEKVRSRSLAMQSPDELIVVAELLREEMGALGVEELETSSIFILDDSSGKAQCWFTTKDADNPAKSVSDRITINLQDTWVGRQMNKFYGSRQDTTSILTKGDHRIEWFRYIEQNSDLLGKTEFFEGTIPERTVHLCKFPHGFLGAASPGKISDDSWDLIRRATRVFSFAYTRFLDLQKAEAQAREAQIENALEKVRSRSLAMQSPDELIEVAALLREEMGALGVEELETSSIYIHDDSTNLTQCWFTIKDADDQDKSITDQMTINLQDTWVGQEMLNFYRSRTEQTSVKMVGDKRIEWIRYCGEKSNLFTPDGFYGDSIPERTYHLYKFSNGYIGAASPGEISDESWDLLRRATSVFSFAYTRFMDLKKAKEQTREAQIELSLERIRARVTGMQESSDLLDIVVGMRTEFVNLGHEAHYFWHMRWLPDTYKKAMTSGDGTKIGMVMTLPRHIHGDIQAVAAWEKAKDPIHVMAMDVDVAVDYVDKMITLGDFERVDPQAPTLDDIRHIGGLTFVMARTTHGEIGFSLPGVVPDPPKDAVDTLVRFAGVFDLAYRRFEDLKKAEAQARENQIELALEKVRSRTMTMERSSELADTSVVVFKELLNLGIAPNRLFIGIIKENGNAVEAWATNEDGSKIENQFQLYPSENKSIQKMVNAWKQEKKSTIIDMSGKELKDYFHYLNKVMRIPFIDGLQQKRRVQTIAYFSGGLIGMAAPEEQPQETTELLERFAAVFNLTYTRFNDLKIAEKQAIQAEKDLIQIKQARQKAEDALIELKATQTQLVQQEKLASLGQLTAGIAHEIKNPLNFVNNFSEVSVELIDEALEEIEKLDHSDVKEEIVEILNDVKGNLVKVHSHGSRADSIVKSMLQHSRGGSGKKEPTDLNALIKEYVNLSFHGMRAGKNPINVDIQLDLDEKIGKVNLIGEDFSRVLLNICNNAFDAMREKAKTETDYLPILSVKTERTTNDGIRIAISDNGPGIPDELKDKILQPFFTTKKGTEGTGLGLSITHDIVKAHGGTLDIESKPGKTNLRINLKL